MLVKPGNGIDSFFFRRDVAADTTAGELAESLAAHSSLQQSDTPPLSVRFEHKGVLLTGSETAAELDLFNTVRQLVPLFEY
jgi:hypothetical protein